MNHKHYLIALDLDGTLLQNNKEISAYNQEVISQAKKEGHIVVIATGRSHLTSMQYYELLQLNTAMINYNGAYIHHPFDDKWGPAIKNPISKQTALQIIDKCYDLDMHNIWVESQHNILLDQHDEEIIDIFHAIHRKKGDVPISIGRIKDQLNEHPISLLIHPRKNHIGTLKHYLDNHFYESVEYRIWGEPWNFFEIVKKGMSKAFGLQKLSQYYNIPQERMIAFGDEDNDLEMINYVGTGVAMANGISELKSIADHITLTNENDGVGSFLADYFQFQIKVG